MSLSFGPLRINTLGTMSDVRAVAGVMVSTSVEGFPAMEAFYLALLGDAVRSRRAGFVNFEWGPFRLTMTIHDAIEGNAAEPARIIVNLAVDDADAAEATARDLGAEIVRPASDEPWGGRICTLRDPDGNYLQLMQLP